MGRKSTIWRNKEVTKKLGFISLGCSKNLVDTEMMVGIMEKAGYELTEDLAEAHVIIINTCTFIDPAKEESIQTILETAEYKKTGVCERLVAAGCLSQQYKEALAKEIPEVDIFIGTDSWQDILDAVNESYANGGEKVFKFGTIPCANEELIPRASLTPKYTAYVKIAEGCSNGCTFCYIPYVRGPMRSRPISSIVHEVRRLAAEGVRGFNLIAQDLSCYGRDLGTNRASLLRELVKIEGVKWIRLHYAYPNQFPLDLLDVMREKPNVCKYLDIALQHISDNMLNRMHRHVSKQETIDLLKTIRERVPGIHIRTTLMVGFPGETQEDFHELLEFVRTQRFERMGAFAYSEEEGTYSANNYEDDVPAEVKQRRLDKLMILQQEISAEVEAEKVGKILKVIIDRKEGDYYIGRTEFCSPEVDPEVLIKAGEKRLRVGCFYNVKITQSEEFDLYGEVVK